MILAILSILAFVMYKAYRLSKRHTRTQVPSEMDGEGPPNEDRGELEAQNAVIGELQDTSQRPGVTHAQTSHDGADDDETTPCIPRPTNQSPRTPAQSIPRPLNPTPVTAWLGLRRANARRRIILESVHARDRYKRRLYRRLDGRNDGTMDDYSPLEPIPPSDDDALWFDFSDEYNAEIFENGIASRSAMATAASVFEQSSLSGKGKCAGNGTSSRPAVAPAAHVVEQSGPSGKGKCAEIKSSSVETQYRWREHGT